MLSRSRSRLILAPPAKIALAWQRRVAHFSQDVLRMVTVRLRNTGLNGSEDRAGIGQITADRRPRQLGRQRQQNNTHAKETRELKNISASYPAGHAGVDKENHLNQTSQKERSGQHAVVKPELFLVGLFGD